MMNASEFDSFKKQLDEQNVQLVAVSKVHPIERIQTIYDYGQRIFGENRAQEMAHKHEQLPKDIRWHMIGPLQTNKVKYIIDFVDMIESVDRVKVVKEIQKRASAIDRKVNVLLQMHIAEEEQKHGFSKNEILELLTKANEYPNICFRGLMGMATLTQDEDKIRNEFNVLRNLFAKVSNEYTDLDEFNILSMGMTGDYQIAIDCGSNCVRIGSKIFGPRPKR